MFDLKGINYQEHLKPLSNRLKRAKNNIIKGEDEQMKELLKEMIKKDSNIDEEDLIYFKQGIIDDYTQWFLTELETAIDELKEEVEGE